MSSLGNLVKAGVGATCLYLAPVDAEAQEGFPEIVQDDLLSIGQKVIDVRLSELCGVQFPQGIDAGFKTKVMQDPKVIGAIDECRDKLSDLKVIGGDTPFSDMYEWMKTGCLPADYDIWCGDQEGLMSYLSEISEGQGGLLSFRTKCRSRGCEDTCFNQVATSLAASTVMIYGGSSFPKYNPAKVVYNEYYKGMLLESARGELSKAKTRMLSDPELPGSIKPRYEWRINTFSAEDLGKVFDNFPLMVDHSRASIYSRLLKNLELRSVDVATLDHDVIGRAYANEHRYEIDPYIATYPEFKRVNIHELLHLFLQGKSNDKFFRNLGEGITEYLTHKLANLAGIKLEEVSYRGVYNFAEQLSRLDEGGMITFYTGENVPNVPDYALENYSKELGVVFDTKEKKHLAITIISRLSTGSGCRSVDTEEIKSFIKDLFSSTFDTDTDIGVQEMNEHYNNLAKRLKKLMDEH